MSATEQGPERPLVTFSDLMAKVGYLLFYWSLLEQALAEGTQEAERNAGVQVRRVSGTFNQRLDRWCDLARGLSANANKVALVDQIREQALELRNIRNTIVHGLMAGRSMPKAQPAYIVCAVGGYDNANGQTLRYSMDDLEHFAQAADACRRAFRDPDHFNYRLNSQC
jgi:hypothetical protein